MKKLYLLDAYALIYRAYYAFIHAPITNSQGFNTSAILGFVNTLYEILDKEKPTHIGVAFDRSEKTFRHEAYPEYKAQREKTPEDISAAIPYIKDIIRGFNIPIYEEIGFEADDIIGTLAFQAEQAGFDVVMVTPDKDYGQLVKPHIFQYRPAHGKESPQLLREEDVAAKYGLQRTAQVIDYLGLMGDASDNVPGCPGVGPKTASSLIQKFDTIEGIYEHLDEVKGKLRENLEAHREQVLFSKFLVTIKTDVPITLNEDELLLQEPDYPTLFPIFEKLEFRSMLRKIFPKSFLDSVLRSKTPLPKSSNTPENQAVSPADCFQAILGGVEKPDFAIQVVEDENDRLAFFEQAFLAKKISLSLITTPDAPINAKITGFALTCDGMAVGYFPLPYFLDGHQNLRTQLEKILLKEEIEKVVYNYKQVLLLLKTHGLEMRGPVFDVMLAHYVIDPERPHQLEILVENYLHASFTPQTEDNTPRDIFHQGGNSQNDAQVAGERAAFAFALAPILTKELDAKGARSVFEAIEIPLAPVLADMEFNGICIAPRTFKEISQIFSARMKEYEAQIYALAGQEFNISSPRQVGEILFEVLKLDEKAKRTKSGQYETSESVLTALRDKSPVVDAILKYRGVKKLLSTYVDALPQIINPRTRHIHSTFNQAVTATGRLSSSDPNLQNIPVRNEDGKEIRKGFVPEPGCLFFSADYSQIELRIMAHLSQDEHMIEAFKQGYDIHAATAAKIFHKEIDAVSGDERRKAKTANFGIIYGITSFGLSQRIGISRGESKELIDNYFASFPRIANYIETIVEKARQNGFAETLAGRRRYLPDILSRNAQVRKFAERNAVNAPIQGTAADIIKLAMIRIWKRFKEEGIQSKMILQVHDELNFSVVPEEKERVERIVLEEMANAYPLSVPLIADCGWGNNWLEAH